MSETGKGPMNDLDRQSRAQIGKQAHRDASGNRRGEVGLLWEEGACRYNLLIDALPSMVSVLNTSNTDAVGKLLSILHSPEVAGAYRPHGPPP